MKRILLTTLASIGLFYVSYAQRGSGIRPSQQAPADYTGRSWTYGQNSIATTTGLADTVFLYPAQGDNLVTPTDSVLGNLIYVIQNKPINYVGDNMIFLGISSNTGDTIRFRNKYNTVFKFNTAADSTIVLQKKKRYRITFVWDGTYWFETGKVISTGQFTENSWDVFYDKNSILSYRKREINSLR